MKMFVRAQEVYLHRDPVDFRKQINGLTAIVELEIKQSLNTGALFFVLQQTPLQTETSVLGQNRLLPWV
jgi:hypothetical protein